MGHPYNIKGNFNYPEIVNLSTKNELQARF